MGLVVGNSQVAFEKAENSSLNLIGKTYSFQEVPNEVGSSLLLYVCDPVTVIFKWEGEQGLPPLRKLFTKSQCVNEEKV